jgi:uncharacterized repeat protein (TIGR01451 family)
MKIKLCLLLYAFLFLILHTVSAQVIRPFSPRYTKSSVRGNIVFVSNSIISSQGVSTASVPPGGTAQNNDGVGININVDVVPPITMLSFGSAWKYFSNGTRPTNWQTVAFDDAAWASGNGKFGYLAGQTTCIASGCTPVCTPAVNCNKYRTYYFRRILNVPDPSIYTNIQLNLKRDDGVVIYINGIEVARNNMPAGIPAQNTLASSDLNYPTGEDYQANLSSSVFTAGNNTIAVEIHTAKDRAEEMSFDMQILGGTATTTFNSSTADLNLATCSEVLWAGLYWGADQGSNGNDSSWIGGSYASALLKLPGGSYQVVNSQQTDKHTNANSPGLDHTGYNCFADITSIINRTNPNGTYSVANVLGPIGITNACGGWTIVIAYSNPTLTPRNLFVADGQVLVNSGGGNVDASITGFLTPPTGSVTCELGAVVYDGDRTQNDAFSFRQQGAAGFYNLTPNATSNSSDMWNSTISYKGAVVTTRNPAYNNTLGYDADIIDLPNAGNAQLGNNKTSATVRFSSTSENYFVTVLTTSILQYNPAFQLSKSSADVNGGSLLAGDTLRYTITYSNAGNDASINTKIIDSLPFNLGFVPGTLKIDGVAKTDLSGDDQAYYDPLGRKIVFHVGTGAGAVSGGSVAIGSGGTVEFDAVLASSCRVLSCGVNVKNSARIEYSGVASSEALYDSSGVFMSGCLIQGGASNVLTVGSCFVPGDTSLANNCSINSITLPWSKYVGYTFYSAMPFTNANRYNPYTPVTSSGTYYAYFNSGAGCSDTITINVSIILCVDIDDDNDGIPDYVELNNPLALTDADNDGIPNWNDATYPGYIDRNGDGYNDNFDPMADSDNDGKANYIDADFSGFTDSNGDGVDDLVDKDLDGIPNNIDLDSDNDGIPDVVESFGTDVNGDGRIDNYSDADNDGLSQNVDGSGGGVSGSATGLGTLDIDGDGTPNYLDLDSDNDGIPDIQEVYSTDVNNNGRCDSFTDTDKDGYADAIDGDVGNDGVAENAAAVLKTGADGNGDGRCDSWPNKNMDADSKPNPYDLDSDNDGITDVREAQFGDANRDGRIDGALNSDGWNSSVAAMGTLVLLNTDGTGRSNPYDIDADDDGIPDNVESRTTNSYILPSAMDTDGDGLLDSHDGIVGFGGSGTNPVDTDNDTVPDYLDGDTDSDGLIDRVEGNDLNLNGRQDDNVTLTGLDSDDDGLDDRFDNNNSTSKGTSAYMGNGGTTNGDPSPGSITTVQHTTVPGNAGCPTERDWRCVFYVLKCNFTVFKGVLTNQTTQLSWTAHCRQEVDSFIVQRSVDGQYFFNVATVPGKPMAQEVEAYTAVDQVGFLATEVIYYRLITVFNIGKVNVSGAVLVKKNTTDDMDIHILPNPVRTNLQIVVTGKRNCIGRFSILDASGKIIQAFTEKIYTGNNTLSYELSGHFSNGMYFLRVDLGEEKLVRKFVVLR